MADISKVKLPDGQVYDILDETAARAAHVITEDGSLSLNNDTSELGKVSVSQSVGIPSEDGQGVDTIGGAVSFVQNSFTSSNSGEVTYSEHSEIYELPGVDSDLDEDKTYQIMTTKEYPNLASDVESLKNAVFGQSSGEEEEEESTVIDIHNKIWTDNADVTVDNNTTYFHDGTAEIASINANEFNIYTYKIVPVESSNGGGIAFVVE